MSWSREKFLSILDSNIAKKIFADGEVSAYVTLFNEDNKAALLHANGIHANSNINEALLMLQLVSAFGRKDSGRLHELLYQNKVAAGVRLDYFLPLYMADNDAGEDIFVTSVKIMLNGEPDHNITLAEGSMVHQLGDHQGELYTQNELNDLSHYVNNSFEIRKLLQHAPNKTVVQPTKEALNYILNNGLTYRDSNNNPVIVFIPGAMNIEGYSIPAMIKRLHDNSSLISDIGFFATQGIVWSIILGDVAAVNQFIACNPDFTIQDEMGNVNVIAWAASTYCAVQNNKDYQDRLFTIMQNLLAASQENLNVKNNVGKAPLDYLNDEVKNLLQPHLKRMASY